MKTLALYVDDDGYAHQCLMTHETTTFPDFKDILPYYNDGCTLYLINIYDDDERPDVVDKFLNEVPCEFVSF